MKIAGCDFCFEDDFSKAVKRTGFVSKDLASPEVIKLLEGKRITGLRLRNINDRQMAADGTVLFLEIETAEDVVEFLMRVERMITVDNRALYRFKCSCGKISEQFELPEPKPTGEKFVEVSEYIKLNPFQWSDYQQFNDFKSHEHLK